MEQVPITPVDDGNRFFQRVLGYYDAPAYVRRARQMEESYEQLLAGCRKQRDDWLVMVRIRLALLRALAGDWTVLSPLVADDAQLDLLRTMEAELQPRLRHRVDATSSVRALRRMLGELTESIERFNTRWREYLAKVDVSRVNELREAYNRYYLLEKECAGHSPTLARRGFRRMGPLTMEELAALLPPLPVPQPR
jgi:hypothetical protein